jgi:hypothetical protein
MACHTFNMVYMALGLHDPISVVAETAGHNIDSYPKWSIIRFEFPADGNRPAIPVTWYDGKKKPNPELIGGKELSGSGALVIGDKGTLYAPGDYAEDYQLLNGAVEKEVSFVQSSGHFTKWARAIRGGEPAVSNFPDYAGPLTETILLGNLAVWADGKKIEWDAKNLVATNAPEVAHIVRRPYRGGYSL